jgi:purine-binding chemotaxis protein CheW
MRREEEMSPASERQRRLEALAQRAEALAADHESRRAEVLAERARVLARPTAPPPPADLLTLVSVRIAGERFGLEAVHVREVCRLTHFSPLPGSAPPVFGVTVWRGELLLLLDIRRAVGFSGAALNDLRHVVVLQGPTAPLGVLVDEVLDIAMVRSEDVRPMEDGGRMRGDLVRGVTSDALVVLETTALMRELN